MKIENQILKTEREIIEENNVENKISEIIIIEQKTEFKTENNIENIVENKIENEIENKIENRIENKIEESIEERIIRMQKNDDDQLNFETLYSGKNDVLNPLPIKRPISLNRIPSIRLSMAMRKTNEKNMSNYNISTLNYQNNNFNNYNSDNFSSDGDNKSDNGSVKNSRNGSRSGSPSLLKRVNSFSNLTSFLNPKKSEKNSVSMKKTKKYEMSHLHGKMKLNYREKPFDGNGIINFVSTEGGRSTYANAHMSGN